MLASYQIISVIRLFLSNDAKPRILRQERPNTVMAKKFSVSSLIIGIPV
ncbi:hypothetical protein DJ39_1669 [Yersinia ruckeri ATCC 29473]|uniref:Uncharacterized protein n=1 Tax=Yersinia ruckeri TaxID=29486 RepID=A0A085U811_YERRU|nr:hypothetical protein QMA0440_01529 [Yersinia ruckeri]EEQ00596.1 hypothetical protein yruck0001_14220 [Yersinia ruckeri ATCC 29473]KFE39324.1 hypothetical protein nADLYRO1b_1511 [Yersinia ruckeri]KGA51182.1 hypothetical protein DJ39_1669 [Yersinia ruckeri ATCC 29473]QTD76821.1 Uncharacterized protein YR821_1900 [Yersinia ruckeri]